ncbi:hypothetical protein TNCV_3959751 [Trichonephila clavipes]|nr:hypothetical protein TNCV_3959751 [Trichonephila clavipes]
MALRKWYTKIFLRNHKLLERVPTTKNAGLPLPIEGLSNIRKYPGHLPDITYKDDNPLNQGLFGVDGACVNLESSHDPRGRV